MNFEWLMIGFSVTVLLIASYTDLRWRIVPDWVSIGAIFIAFIYRFYSGNMMDYIIGAVFMFVAIIIFDLIRSGSIGGGDLKLFVFLGLAVGFPIINGIAFLTFIGAVLISVIWKRKELPLVPVIALSYAVLLPVIIHQL